MFYSYIDKEKVLLTRVSMVVTKVYQVRYVALQ